MVYVIAVLIIVILFQVNYTIEQDALLERKKYKILQLEALLEEKKYKILQLESKIEYLEGARNEEINKGRVYRKI